MNKPVPSIYKSHRLFQRTTKSWPALRIAASDDNGASWTIRTVSDSTSGDTDPSLGISADGTNYLGFADGDGDGRVSVSHDRVLTWIYTQDVGVQHGVQNTVFPAAIAGDSDRAAYFTGPDAIGYFVDMRTDALSAVAYKYGTYIHNADNIEGTRQRREL